MITNPKMVYKVWRQETKYDQREGNYEVPVLVCICSTAEEVLAAFEFNKWMKVTYEVAVPITNTSAGNAER